MNTSDSAALALAREQQLMNPESFARAMALADQINAAQQVAVQQAAPLQPVNRTAPVANPYYHAQGAVEDYQATGLLPPIYQRDPYGTATYMVGPDGSVAHLAAFPSRSPHVLFGDPRPLGSGAWVSALATLMNAARHPAAQMLRMPMQQAPAQARTAVRQQAPASGQPKAPAKSQPEQKPQGVPEWEAYHNQGFEEPVAASTPAVASAPVVVNGWQPGPGPNGDAIQVQYPAPTGPTGRVPTGQTFKLGWDEAFKNGVSGWLGLSDPVAPAPRNNLCVKL